MSERAEPEHPSGRWVAVGIAFVAAATRLPGLSRIGLRGDEDISTLAARAIAEWGWPRLPSGHGYFRGPLYHYLAAPWTLWGIDWVPRLFSVGVSVATAVLVQRLGRRWLGDLPASCAAVLYAVSLTEINLARQVRMYALYQLLGFVALYALFRFWRTPTLRSGLVALGSVAATLPVHALGATLAALFLLAACRAPRPSVRTLAVGCVPILGGLAWLNQRWVARGMRGDLPRPEFAADASNVVPATPDPWLFAIVGAVAVLLVAALAYGTVRDRPPWSRLLAMASVATAVALAGFGKVGLAAGALVLVALHRDELLPDRRGPRVLWLSAIVVTALALVRVATFAMDRAPAAIAYDLFGRELGRFVRDLVAWPPAVAVPAVVGSAFVLVRAWNGRASPGERFALSAVVAVVASRALLADKVVSRYLADVWPLWELLAGWTIAQSATAVMEWKGLPGTPALRRAGVLLLAGAAIVALPGTGVAGTIAYLGRGHGEVHGAAARVTGFTADQRGVAAWLLPRLRAEERVVATDWLSTYCYVGRVDGWIRTAGYEVQSVWVDGELRDVYLGARVVSDLAALRAFTSAAPSWIVVGGSELDDPGVLDASVRNWLVAQRPAFASADGRTFVLRIEPEGP